MLVLLHRHVKPPVVWRELTNDKAYSSAGYFTYYADHIIGPPFTVSTRAVNLLKKILENYSIFACRIRDASSSQQENARGQ